MLKVLHDLRIAGPVDFPDSGVPQDTRLNFKALAMAPDLAVSALIHPDFRTRKLTRQILRAPTAAAAMLLNGHGVSYGEHAKPQAWPKRAIAWTRRVIRGERPFPVLPVDGLLRDSVWRLYLERSLDSGDRALLDRAEIAISPVAEDALNGRGLTRHRRIATTGYDAIVFPEPRTAEISAQTLKIIRYHDALPLTAADLFRPGVAEQHYALLSRCARDAYFVCNSDVTRANLVRLFPSLEPRTAVVPCTLASPGNLSNLGVDEIVRRNLFKASPDDDDRHIFRAGVQDRPFLLMVSTIEPRKNYLTAIEAFEILRHRLPRPPRLIVVGKPALGAERVLAAMRPLAADGALVHLTAVPRSQLNKLYAEATALLFPSLDEGFGYSPLEALSHNTPMVVSDIPTHRWVLRDAALYAPAMDARALAHQLELLIAAPDRQARTAALMAKAGAVLDRFSAETTSRQWSEVLHRFKTAPALRRFEDRP